MNLLFIYGAGGHATVVAEAARLLGWEIGGFVEDSSSRYGEILAGVEVIPPADLPEGAAVAVAFGDCAKRLALGNWLKTAGFHLPALVHPAACVATGVSLGDGCFVGALANIDPGCRIGSLSIINNQAGVCHGSEVGVGSHICPGSILAGNVVTGEVCWIGLGSRVIEKIRIGNGVFIGAGSTVVKDLPDGVRAWGNPARVCEPGRLERL